MNTLKVNPADIDKVFSAMGLSRPTPGQTPAQDGGDADETSTSSTDIADGAREAQVEVDKLDESVVKVKESVGKVVSKFKDAAVKIGEAAKEVLEKLTPSLETTRDKARRISLNIEKIVGNVTNADFISSLTTIKDLFCKIAEKAKCIAEDLQSIVDSIGKLPIEILRSFNQIFNNTRNMTVASANAASQLLVSLNALDGKIVKYTTEHTIVTKNVTESASKNTEKVATKKAAGGIIPGVGGRDIMPILATPGEFVVRRAMVDKYGIPLLNKINQGALDPNFNIPGNVSLNVESAGSSSSSPVYNNTYDMRFSISGANANADEIAEKVIYKIKGINDSSLRSNLAY